MSNELIKCKTCGADMAANAKACPSCGAKNKKPFYKKWWFWVIIVIVILAAIGSSSGGEDQAEGGAAENNAVSDQSAESQAAEQKKEKLTIEGDVTVESDMFSYNISGVIKNNTDKEMSYAQVTFNLYDSEGNLLGTALDNVNNLAGGGTWKFKAMAMISDTEEIASYELAEITGY